MSSNIKMVMCLCVEVLCKNQSTFDELDQGNAAISFSDIAVNLSFSDKAGLMQ